MAESGGQEKTEKATPKKRQDARTKEGNVLQSKEINTAVSILGTFFAMSLLGPWMYRQLTYQIGFFHERMSQNYEITAEFFREMSLWIITFVVTIIFPILFVSMLLGIIPSVFQTKGLFTMQPLKPKFSKLNPITGMKRLFSIQSFVNVLKGIIIIAAISSIAYTRINALIPLLGKLPDMEAEQAVRFIARNIFQIILLIALVFAFISVLDYLFQWWQFEKKLKMSKQEVKDEYKQIEGDPKIKSKIRQKQREIAQNRMMQEVPSADVVIRNPTHFAVALRYDAEVVGSAPKVIAKGKDMLAMKIIAIAEEHGIKVTEDRPLARLLHDTVDLGRQIPPELYAAVVEIFAEVESFKERIKLK